MASTASDLGPGYDIVKFGKVYGNLLSCNMLPKYSYHLSLAYILSSAKSLGATTPASRPSAYRPSLSISIHSSTCGKVSHSCSSGINNVQFLRDTGPKVTIVSIFPAPSPVLGKYKVVYYIAKKAEVLCCEVIPAFVGITCPELEPADHTIYFI